MCIVSHLRSDRTLSISFSGFFLTSLVIPKELYRLHGIHNQANVYCRNDNHRPIVQEV